MLKYKIVLKGLMDGADDYELVEVMVQAKTEQLIDELITNIIYQIRLDNKYYKMKYISKVKCQ